MLCLTGTKTSSSDGGYNGARLFLLAIGGNNVYGYKTHIQRGLYTKMLHEENVNNVHWFPLTVMQRVHSSL